MRGSPILALLSRFASVAKSLPNLEFLMASREVRWHWLRLVLTLTITAYKTPGGSCSLLPSHSLSDSLSDLLARATHNYIPQLCCCLHLFLHHLSLSSG